MDASCRAQGLTRGTVGERMTALGKDPTQLFPNTDDGRAQILAYLNAGSPTSAPACRAPSRRWCRAIWSIKRVPPEIEAGAPGGYAAAGTIDGTVPGKYYINLRTTDHVAALQPADPRPITRAFRAISGRANIPTSCRSSARCSPSTLIRKAGRSTPSSSPTSSASTKAIRSASSAISSRSRSAPAGWSSTPASTPSAGPASRRSNGSRPPTARRVEEVPARSTAIAPGPARPAATRSATARSSACARRSQRRSARASTSASFNDAVVKGGGVPMVVLARIDRRLQRTADCGLSMLRSP